MMGLFLCVMSTCIPSGLGASEAHLCLPQFTHFSMSLCWHFNHFTRHVLLKESVRCMQNATELIVPSGNKNSRYAPPFQVAISLWIFLMLYQFSKFNIYKIEPIIKFLVHAATSDVLTIEMHSNLYAEETQNLKVSKTNFAVARPLSRGKCLNRRGNSYWSFYKTFELYSLLEIREWPQEFTISCENM